MSTDDGVQRYIDTKRAVLRNMGRIQDQLAKLQESLPELADCAERLRRIQAILDDPFTVSGHGLPSSP